jgi:hypothetical protein
MNRRWALSGEILTKDVDRAEDGSRAGVAAGLAGLAGAHEGRPLISS